MALPAIRVDVGEAKQLAAAAADYAETLAMVANTARRTRERLIRLAFNPDDDAVLNCEWIEDRALAALGRYGSKDITA